jgi:putative transposase
MASRVWRRPQPVLACTDPDRGTVSEELRSPLRDLPDDKTAVFQDEADINLNPEVGCLWMARGVQAELPTPGENQKCYLPGRCTGGRARC